MKIAVLKLKLYAPWVHSLKEKRRIIGAAAIVPDSAMADSLMDGIVCFVEENTEAEIVQEERAAVDWGGRSSGRPLCFAYPDWSENQSQKKEYSEDL